MADDFTTIQIYRKDEPRFDKLKVTPGERDRDAFHRILDLAENQVHALEEKNRDP